MEQIVINLYGGPGTGKTTTAKGVFTLLKLHGVNTEIADEYAKDLTWEKRWFTLQNQTYVTAKQEHRIYRLKDVDVVITDSPINIGIVYTPGPYDPDFVKYVNKMYSKYNNINYFIKRVKPYMPKGRSQTVSEAKAFDVKIFELIKEEPFKEVPGNHVGINIIANEILSNLGKKQTISFEEIG